MSHEELVKKNLLVISHDYQSFTKDQIAELSFSFSNVFSLVRHNSFAEISNYINIPSINRYSKNNLIDLHDKPNNVHVIPTSLFYLPFNWTYKRIGSAHYDTVYKTIKGHDIHFNLVHSYFIWSSGYVGVRLKEQFNVPLVITGHGYDVYILPFIDESWKNLITTTINNADHIITVSNKNKEILKSLKTKTPITVIPNGYKKDLFYPMNKNMCRTQLGIPLNKKILLTVGNLVEIKGHKYLIDALKLLKKRRNDFICYIIGEGILKFALQKQIQHNELNENIKLIGWVSHEEIPVWMNAADLFILPSLNEGNPTVMFECLGCGRPFIGTCVGGVPEIITSENYGLLCEPANQKDLADKILIALEKDWDKEKILEYAKQFMWKNIAKKIMGIYKLLV